MADLSFVRVNDDGEILELPVESDGTVLLSTLTAQFPKATGLTYKPEDSDCLRSVRLAEGHLHPPPGGWESFEFTCIIPKDNKRKSGDDDKQSAKLKRLEGKKCTDLVVLSLAWRTDEEALKKYFSRYGDVVMAQIKRDPNTKLSKGYGFIRFRDYESQVMCLAEHHVIDNRWCDVRIPTSKIEGDRQEIRRKIHVGHITESMDEELLRNHFSQYGNVSDVFVPKPFRSFAFVTFEDSDVVNDLVGKDEEIDGVTVSIGSAVPKLQWSNNGGNMMNNLDFSRLGKMPGMGTFPGSGMPNTNLNIPNMAGLMNFGPDNQAPMFNSNNNGASSGFSTGGGRASRGGVGGGGRMNQKGGGKQGFSGGGTVGNPLMDGGGAGPQAGPLSAARSAQFQQQQIMAAGQAAAAFQMAMQAALNSGGGNPNGPGFGIQNPGGGGPNLSGGGTHGGRGSGNGSGNGPPMGRLNGSMGMGMVGIGNGFQNGTNGDRSGRNAGGMGGLPNMNIMNMAGINNNGDVPSTAAFGGGPNNWNGNGPMRFRFGR